MTIAEPHRPNGRTPGGPGGPDNPVEAGFRRLDLAPAVGQFAALNEVVDSFLGRGLLTEDVKDRLHRWAAKVKLESKGYTAAQIHNVIEQKPPEPPRVEPAVPANSFNGNVGSISFKAGGPSDPRVDDVEKPNGRGHQDPGSRAEAPQPRQSTLEAALGHAARGWLVLPVHPTSKRPLLPGDEGKGGVYLASNDPQEIRQWWARWPKALIGIRTGSTLGAFVVDFDVCVDDLTGEVFTIKGLLASLEGEIGCSLPKTWMEQTPRGGRYCYFKIPSGIEIRNRNPLKPLQHIDVKGENAYITVAPSERPDGSYHWIHSPDDTELADPPAALVDLILKRGRWEPQQPKREQRPRSQGGTGH
jgi:hypothetical protein